MRNKLLLMSAAIALCFPAGASAYDASGVAVFAALKVAAYPGETISADMVVLMPAGHQSVLGSIVTDKESVIGKVARRTLLPGQPIPRNAVREPYAVLQGKTVSIVFQSGRSRSRASRLRWSRAAPAKSSPRAIPIRE